MFTRSMSYVTQNFILRVYIKIIFLFTEWKGDQFDMTFIFIDFLILSSPSRNAYNTEK